jgi:hypothetical protein
LRSGASRRSEPVIELADPANSRLSFNNLTEAHVLDALRRQYQVELPQIRRAVNYLREHFRSQHPLVHHQMLTDRKHLFVEAAGLKDVINASKHGQLAMRDLIGLHLHRVEWDKDGFVARLYPFTRSRRGPVEEASLFRGLPSRSSFADRTGPPPPLRGYGAASFACIHERRLVDQTRASWNQIVGWLKQFDSVRRTSC